MAKVLHTVLTNHNGDPECLCGFQAPPQESMYLVYLVTTRHVAEMNNGTDDHRFDDMGPEHGTE